ncbi:MAG: ABC transporter permease [Muribaculaceae bacterium]|nr:ABC transporter permease [Muribaculaceae bacterium]
MFKKIKYWTLDVARVMRRELNLSLTDVGVLLFFIFLPLAYPLVYTLIYNPEVAREIPVAVVDDCRSAQSREFVRMTDATEAIHIIGYATDMAEARRWKDTKDCYGILYIPHDYSRSLGRGEQANVTFYSDMSLLLRYRSMLMSMTNLQLAAGAKIRTETMSSLGMAGASMSGSPVENVSFMLGDTEQGFASFVIPGIIILILQQSMLLGITLLGGTSYERRLRNGGFDPLAIRASATATVIGRMLCYVLIYMPITVYVLHFVPIFFSLPHIGSPLQYFPFIFPMLIATAFLGMTVETIVKEREMSFMVVVFTSVVFLFLSGLTWPRYAMSRLWLAIGDLIPATWGMEGFIRINSNNATIYDNSQCYLMMWALAIFYFFTAIWTCRYTAYTARRDALSTAS